MRQPAGTASRFAPPLEARYAAFFHRFNQGAFYEAHAALEPLWLERRQDPQDNFYKGLIQLAGALLHLQKGRPDPAATLFTRAHALLRPYAPPTNGWRWMPSWTGSRACSPRCAPAGCQPRSLNSCPKGLNSRPWLPRHFFLNIPNPSLVHILFARAASPRARKRRPFTRPSRQQPPFAQAAAHPKPSWGRTGRRLTPPAATNHQTQNRHERQAQPTTARR
jgi:hypothetical protein